MDSENFQSYEDIIDANYQNVMPIGKTDLNSKRSAMKFLSTRNRRHRKSPIFQLENDPKDFYRKLISFLLTRPQSVYYNFVIVPSKSSRRYRKAFYDPLAEFAINLMKSKTPYSAEMSPRDTTVKNTYKIEEESITNQPIVKRLVSNS